MTLGIQDSYKRVRLILSSLLIQQYDVLLSLAPAPRIAELLPIIYILDRELHG